MLNRKRKGFSLAELIVVVLILGILIAASIGIGAKQVKKARIQETTSFLQTIDTNIEEAIMDLGFLSECTDIDTDNTTDTPHEIATKAFLRELEDIYLPCNIDMATLAPATGGTYQGFSVTLTGAQDAWKMPYRMYYLYDAAAESYRITVASNGPNNIPSAFAATAYIDDTGADRFEDDIVVIMISRQR